MIKSCLRIAQDSSGSRGIDVLPDFRPETCLRRVAAALRGAASAAPWCLRLRWLE
jgi:hypothetical protein